MKIMRQLFCVSLILVMTHFSASAQIPNGSFEDWDGLNPSGWTTNNNDTVVPPLSTVLVRKDTLNPFQGKNAMVLLQTWAHSSWAETSFANTGHPTSLTAFVRCNAYDTVSIRVEVLSNGEVAGEGIWSVTDTVIDDWTKIVIPISQSDLEVFKTRIHIQGGQIPGPADEISVLWVDNLYLGNTPLGIQDDMLAQKWMLYPNPTDGNVDILANSDRLNFVATLYNATGVKMLETIESTFDMSPFPQGTYYLQIRTKEAMVMRKIIRN